MVCIVIKYIINRLSIVCCTREWIREKVSESKREENAAYNKTCLTLITVSNTIATTIFLLKALLLFDTKCAYQTVSCFSNAMNFHFDHPPYFCLSINKHLKYNFWHSYGITHSINLHTELQRRKLIYWWWTHKHQKRRSYHFKHNHRQHRQINLIQTPLTQNIKHKICGVKKKIIAFVQNSKSPIGRNCFVEEHILKVGMRRKKNGTSIFMWVRCGKKFTVSKWIDLSGLKH